MEFKSGDYVWAKTNKTYWPAIILLPTTIKKPSKPHAEWVYWFGDKRISEVRMASIVRFHTLFERYAKNRGYFFTMGKSRYAGMIEALRFYKGIGELDASLQRDETDEELLRWAFEGFPGRDHAAKNDVPNQVFYNLQKILNETHEMFEESPKLTGSKGKLATLGVAKLCVSCYHDEVYTQHPLFEGGLCFECKERFEARFFMIGGDGIHYCCAICCSFGNLIVCSTRQCGLSYCPPCLDNLASPELRIYILNAPRWKCFVCSMASYSKTCRFIKCRANWRETLHAFFNTHRASPIPAMPKSKTKLRVLSLFDGISTGLLALQQLNIEVETYYAAELDANAKKIALEHHWHQIEYLGSGDVREVNEAQLVQIQPIHLVLGGSPCNDLSIANPIRKGLYEKTGSGILFFEFCRILALLRKIGNREFFWLFENVASMPEEAKNIISRFLECQPAEVNAACVSPQRRMRYFWGNCPSLRVNFNFDGGHSLQAYLERGRTAAVAQIRTITTNFNSLLQGPLKQHAAYDADNKLSELTINEIEKIFGLPPDYTKHDNLSKSARLTLIGRCWSVQTICMLLHFLKYFYRQQTTDTPNKKHLYSFSP